MRHEVRESLRLADEDAHVHEALEGRLGCTLGCGGPDDRANWEIVAEESGWLGHDQVTVQVLTDCGICEIGEAHRDAGDRVRCRQWSRIPGLVLPGLEVGDLGTADAEQNAQHLDAGHALRQRWVHAGPTDFDIGKVKAGGKTNGLKEIGIG